MATDTERLENNFTYHSPKGDQAARYQTIRTYGQALARIIMNNSIPSREQSLAITKVEEAVMWANAGIARNE